MRVGFVGLGRMGGAMAPHLVGGGLELIVFDRDPALAAAVVQKGARLAADLAALASGCELVITMLPSDDALEAVALEPGGLTEAMPAGAIHVICGTHGVEAVEQVARGHRARGQFLVSCNVLGRPERAVEASLGLVLAGPDAAVERVLPVVTRFGGTVFRAGQDPLSATAVKIANNFVLGCAIEAIGEGMALARRYGVDPELFQRVLTEGLFGCVAYRSYGDVIAKRDWGRVGAAATIGLKDAALALRAAERVGMSLPSAEVWREHLQAACELGEGALDWAVMAREQFRRSGLE